ncbi:type IX secretion system membrane protein PorP/SprF [candidate division KSB1 bacterium]|nr:type IX secretion system membrane protein PorP/SprF [candidate division KSB1 bacterium]
MVTRNRSKIKRQSLGAVCLLLLLMLPCNAAFEDIGIGARPAAMGRAHVAIADDVFGMFYNPAGLGQAQALSFGTMYARLYPGIDDDQLHYAAFSAILPLSFLGKVGVAITNFNIDVYRENMLYLSYAHRLPFNLAAGVNFKLLRWGADGDVDPNTGIRDRNFSYTGFSLDAGLLYSAFSTGNTLLEPFVGAGTVQLGVTLSDLLQPSIAENGDADAKLPLGITGGLAFVRQDARIGVGIKRHAERTRLQLGAEFELYKSRSENLPVQFKLRGGGVRMLSDHNGGEVAAGFGIGVKSYELDYAYVYPLVLEDAGSNHKLSFNFRF